MSGDPGSHREETNEQRVDRNLSELLNELRVALPGVQVLFAFLLVVPFNQRFSSTTSFQRATYFTTLLLAACSTVFLIAPSVHHRLLFRLQEKERIVVIANRLSLVGLTSLAFAVVGVVLLVTDFVLGDPVAIVVACALALLFAIIWYVIPLRHKGNQDEARSDAT
jgi:amino acid transporter